MTHAKALAATVSAAPILRMLRGSRSVCAVIHSFANRTWMISSASYAS